MMMKNRFSITKNQLLTIFICALALLPGCGGGEEKAAEPQALKVVVAPVAEESAAVEARFNATLAAKETVEVRARVSGYLAEKSFEEGSSVNEGQILYKLDDRDLKAALEKAEAETTKAKAAWENENAIKDRMVTLGAKGAVSIQQRDSAVAKAAEAEAAYQAAHSAEETARINLGYATITAPTTGYITRSSVEVGSFIDAGSATLMTTIYKIDPIRAEFSITDKEYGRFKMNQAQHGGDASSIVFRMEIGDMHIPYEHKGVLEMADPVIDGKTNTIGVRAEFPNPDHILRPGLYVNVIGSVGEHQVLTVPEIALVEQGGSQKAVYVVDDQNIIQAVPVKIGGLIGENRIIEEGLEKGRNVVIEGLVTARPGMKVEIVTKEDAAKEDTAAQAPAKDAEASN
ncbi:hypothetical protein C4J81_15050 [Deltaproteobacteria bacterium Smac51]|nr:hypothetical protein C4J81_15050 [Deltaproteobacteria bacterium Smac51]